MIKFKMLPKEYSWLHNHLTILSTTVETHEVADKRIDSLKKKSPIQFAEIRKRETDVQDITSARKFITDNKINFVTGNEILELGKKSYLDLSSNLVNNVKKLHNTYKSPLKDIWVIDLAPPQGPKLLDMVHTVRDLNMYLEFIDPNLGNCFELTLLKTGKFFIKGSFDKQYSEFLINFFKDINSPAEKTTKTKSLPSKCISLDDKVVLILDLENMEKTDEIISQLTDEFSKLSVENKNENESEGETHEQDAFNEQDSFNMK